MNTYKDIQPKPYTRFGKLYTPRETMNTYNADVKPNQSIRIYGAFRNTTRGPVDFDKTFKIGDWAEYDSYNLTYHGTITQIGKNTVTILPRQGERATRLDLYTFCWRNWDFNLQERIRANAIEAQYI